MQERRLTSLLSFLRPGYRCAHGTELDCSFMERASNAREAVLPTSLALSGSVLVANPLDGHQNCLTLSRQRSTGSGGGEEEARELTMNIIPPTTAYGRTSCAKLPRQHEERH